MSQKHSLPILIRLVAPISILIPFVHKPQTKISFRERCLWTVLTLVAYLICCQIPLYGIIRSSSADPFYWFRTVIASNRGTLMELGITPIVTSSMLVQFLVASNLIKIDTQNPQQRKLFDAAQKVFAVCAIFLEAYLLVRSGLYGSFAELGAGNVALILLQLIIAGVIVLMLDEMLENGYGLGSGISLFIATNVCEQICWKALSPTTIHTAKGVQFEGALLEMARVVCSPRRSLRAVWASATRDGLPNLQSLCGFLAVSLLAVYLRDVRLELPLTKKGARGAVGAFPVRLLASSTFPIILQSTIVANIHSVSRILSERYKGVWLVEMLGRWAWRDGHLAPVGGLAYYLAPVVSISAIGRDPLHLLAHVALVSLMCGALSVMLLDTSGATPRKIAQQLEAGGLHFWGKRRRDTLPTLRRVVVPSAVIGGVLVGLLTVLADVISFVGVGSGVLLAVNLVYGYYAKYRKSEGDE